VIRIFTATFLLGLFIIFASASSVWALVNTGWDWHLVDGQPKRTLHYCAGTAVRFSEANNTIDVQNFTPGLPPSFAIWLTEAVEKLNKANTGWKLVPSNATFPPCQILITIADITESRFGGGHATPSDTNGDGKADITKITIDQNLEDTLKNLPEGQDTADKTRDGWSTQGGEATRDPVGVFMHELTHAMRLRHHTDSNHSDTRDSDVSDPRQVGDHNTTLSAEDLKELREAAGSQEQLGSFQVPADGKNISFQGVDISVPMYAFGMIGGFLDLNIYDDAVIPDPLAVPDPYQHVIGSGTVYIRTSSPLEKPVTVKIPYTKEELAGGDSMIIGDLHGYIPTAMREKSLRVFKYVARPFGVKSEIEPHWELVENSKVDTSKKQVVFETKETGIFGISGKKEPKSATETASASLDQNTIIITGVIVLVILAAGGFIFYRKRKK